MVLVSNFYQTKGYDLLFYEPFTKWQWNPFTVSLTAFQHVCYRRANQLYVWHWLNSASAVFPSVCNGVRVEGRVRQAGENAVMQGRDHSISGVFISQQTFLQPKRNGSFNVAFRPQRAYGLPWGPPRLSHSSWAYEHNGHSHVYNHKSTPRGAKQTRSR